MKKTFLIAIAVAMLSLCSCLQKGTTIRLDTDIPAPLGKYVCFPDNSVKVTVSEPDSDGDVAFSLNFDFKIKRHLSAIRYMNFRGTFLSKTKKEIGTLKFKRDQDAVAALAGALRDDNTDKVTVSYVEIGSDGDAEKFLKDVESLKITSSTIYIDIDAANLKVGGRYSSDLSYSEYGNCAFYLNKSQGNIYPEIYFDCVATSSFNYTGTPRINLLTPSGDCILSLPSNTSGEFYLEQGQTGSFHFGGESYTVYDDQLDRLLNNSIIFELVFE